MKNKGLLIALVGAGAILLLTASRKKKRSYKIDVPAPTKITEQEFRTGIVQKALPVAQKVFSLFKKKPKLTAQQQQAVKVLSSGRKIFGNEFPDFC